MQSLQSVSVNKTEDYLIGLLSEDNPERLASLGFGWAGSLQEVKLESTFSER
jgi:hypothetical protein